MKKSKILSLLLSFLLIIAPLSSSFITVKAADEVVWNFDESTGTLTISGVGETGTIDDKAPLGCTTDTIKAVNINSGITKISEGAFYYCSMLSTVTIPSTVTSIEDSAFCYCSMLNEVTIPSSVTNIENFAFQFCSSLESITIPSSLTYMGAYAFYGCSELREITIPDTVTSVGYAAFENTAYFMDYENWVDGVLYIGKHLIKVEIYVSGNFQIKEETVTIGGSAFQDCSKITGVDIPSSVVFIGGYAFAGCTKLSSLVIPSTVKYIGEGAFQNCTELTSIEIPSLVSSIEYNTFANCTSLSVITLPDTLEKIGSNAFLNTDYYNNENNWKNGLLYIGKYLVNADSDTISGKVKIKDNTSLIADRCFFYCTELTGIDMPNTVKYLGEMVFGYCTELVDVKLSTSLTTISVSAFSSCSGLVEITIPSSVTSISDNAFEWCTSLTDVTLPNTLINIGDNAFRYCTALKKMEIPAFVTNIGENAFLVNLVCDASFTIYCYKNSKAHTYAVENDIPVSFIGVSNTDKNTGMSASYENGTFEEEAKLNVSEKSSNSVTLPENYDKSLVYDIGFTVDDIKAEPKKDITVTLPVPDDFDKTALKVFVENENGEFEETDFTLVDGKAAVKISSNGTVVLVDSDSVSAEDKAEESILKVLFDLLMAIIEFFMKALGINS